MKPSEQFFAALIPDGGRRAVNNDLKQYFDSYKKGADIVGDVLKLCVLDPRIKIFAAWGLSDDNASKRSPDEIDILNTVFLEYLEKLRRDVEEDPAYQQVKVVHMGNADLLRADVQARIRDVSIFTNNRTEKIFGLCLAYGSDDEMDRALEVKQRTGYKGNYRDMLDLPRRGGIPYQKVNAIVRTGTNPLEPYTSGYLLPYQGTGTQERYIEEFLPNVKPEEIMTRIDEMFQKKHRSRLGG